MVRFKHPQNPLEVLGRGTTISDEHIRVKINGDQALFRGFAKAIELITQVVEQAKIPDPFQYVLITNGSLIHHTDVQAGLILFNQYHGQVWFKLDSATEQGRELVNHAVLSLDKQTENLITSAQLCATWVQTCMLQFVPDHQDQGLTEADEQAAYLALLKQVSEQVSLQGVLLYSLARPSLQPEAENIASVSLAQLNDFAGRIEQLGLTVKASL